MWKNKRQTPAGFSHLHFTLHRCALPGKGQPRAKLRHQRTALLACLNRRQLHCALLRTASCKQTHNQQQAYVT